MGWKNFRDRLAVAIVIGLPLKWAAMLAFGFNIPEIVTGAEIAGWTLAIQFYFRKAESEAH